METTEFRRSIRDTRSSTTDGRGWCEYTVLSGRLLLVLVRDWGRHFRRVSWSSTVLIEETALGGNFNVEGKFTFVLGSEGLSVEL